MNTAALPLGLFLTAVRLHILSDRTVRHRQGGLRGPAAKSSVMVVLFWPAYPAAHRPSPSPRRPACPATCACPAGRSLDFSFQEGSQDMLMETDARSAPSIIGDFLDVKW